MNKSGKCCFGFRLMLFSALVIVGMGIGLRACADTRDSLRAALAAHLSNDTAKAGLLSRIGVSYLDDKFDSVLLYASRCLRLADSLHYDRGTIAGLRLTALVYEHRNEYTNAIRYFGDALTVCRKINDIPDQILMLRSIAGNYYRLTDYPRAIELNNQSIELSQKINDKSQEGLALIDIGGIYTDQGNNSEALGYYLKGLKAFEQIRDDRGISLSLINIATVYSGIGNYKLAADFIRKAIPINERLHEKEVVFANYVNIGVVYGDMKDYKSALSTFMKAAKMADAIGDKAWQNMVMCNIADAYMHMGNDDSAFSKFTLGLKQAKEVNDTSVLVLAQSSIGRLLVKKGRYQEGIKNLKESFEIARNKQMKQYLFDISGDLSTAYEKLHDFPRSLQYKKLEFAYRDSLNNEKTDKHIQQMQFDYELQKKENQIALQNKNMLISRGQNEKQTLVEWALGAFVVLLIVISFLLFRNIVFVKRNEEKLRRQKEEIQVQAARLEDLVRFKDKTFSVLSHDLRGPMGTLTTAMMMLDEYILSPEEFARIKPEINRQLNSLNNLLDNLLNWAKNSIQGDIVSMAAITGLGKLIEQNVVLLKESADKKMIEIKVDVSEDAFAYCDPGQMDIVLRNLLSNAIKFTPQKGTIGITASVRNDKVLLSVKDSGVGMSEEQISKLFVASPGNNTYGTDGEKGTGLGLLLCYDFIKSNNGKIYVESAINKGSQFLIELPRRITDAK